MAFITTAEINFASILPADYPPAGSYTFGFDTADGKLKKLDHGGVLTVLEVSATTPSLSSVMTVGSTVNSAGIIKTNSNVNAIAVNQNYLMSTNTNVSIDWGQRNLYNSSNEPTVYWEVKKLTLDGTLGNTSLHWGNKELYSANESDPSLNWLSRSLIGDWIATTQAPGNNTTKLATTAFVMAAVAPPVFSIVHLNGPLTYNVLGTEDVLLINTTGGAVDVHMLPVGSATKPLVVKDANGNAAITSFTLVPSTLSSPGESIENPDGASGNVPGATITVSSKFTSLTLVPNVSLNGYNII